MPTMTDELGKLRAGLSQILGVERKLQCATTTHPNLVGV